MSEHTSPKVVELPEGMKREQVLAQLYDIKESLVMTQLVVKRQADEVKKQIMRVNNMIVLMERK